MKWHYKVTLALIGILLVVVVFAPALGNERWVRTLQDSAHGPTFGAVALLILSIVRARPGSGRMALSQQYLLAFAATLLLGVLTEVAQIFVGRDASLLDVRSDLLGALVFLGVFSTFDPQLGRRGRLPGSRAATLTVAAVVLTILAAPLGHAVIEYQRRSARFPVLADFTAGFDRYFVAQGDACVEPVVMPAQWAAHANESAMRVRFQPGARYPGIQFIEPLPDWRAYTALAFDLTNPTGTDLDLVVRVHDARHDNEYADRFNRSLSLPANTRKVFRIPLADIQAGPATRQLDLADVAGVVLFREPGSKVQQMYLSRAWLEADAKAGLQHDH